MNKPITRKRRTREHVIADLSVNFVTDAETFHRLLREAAQTAETA